MTEDAEARLAYVVRRRVLDDVGGIFARAGLQALLVKGAGLAETVYREPWRRTMSDIDLVVRPTALSAALGALVRAGVEVPPIPADRRRSYALFEERAAIVSVGPVRTLVEVHTGLDKVVAHPIDWRGVWARAACVEGLSPSLLVPCREDHALLVVLHLALSDFAHPYAWGDLAALFREGIDHEILALRAEAWGLTLPLALGIERLAVAFPELGLAELRARLVVSPVRLVVARRAFRNHEVRSRGTTWLAKQTVLREDFARWSIGIMRFAVLRCADRLV